MGGTAEGEENTICSKHKDCCGGLSFILDKYVNQTYALTHWYCYPGGVPPNWTNFSNTTNLSGIIFDKPVDNDTYWIEESLREYDAYLAEKKRLFVDIPIMLSQISGALSIFTCTVVIGIFIAILVYQPIIARRCSLRLSVAVSIADMIFSYNQAIPANYFNDWRCTAQAVSQVWAELCSLFFTSAIALNLLLVFVFEFNNTKKIEPYYYAVPLLLATCIVAYPLSKSALYIILKIGWFGYDYWNCFFRYDYNSEYNRDTDENLARYASKVNEITWIFYTSWMCASIIWCAFVVITFWISITEKNRRKQKAASKLGTSSQGEQSTSGVQSGFKMSSNATGTSTAIATATATTTASGTTASSTVNSRSVGSGSGNKSSGSKSGHGTNKIEEKSQKMIQKAVMRIAFYPVVPLVTALPLALALSINQLTEIYQFGWFSAIMSNLQGFGNSAIFYFDPAVALARETFRKYMTERFVLKYHPILDNGERSVKPVQIGNVTNFQEAWEKFMYHFAKLFAARKRDFIVENTKKKAISKVSTAVNSNKPPARKSALLEDDKVEAPSGYDSAATKMMYSSAEKSSGYDPVQSSPESVVGDIQINVEDEDEEIDEAVVLNGIQNL